MREWLGSPSARPALKAVRATLQVTRRTSGNPVVLAQYGYLADGRLAWRCPGVCDGSSGPRRWLVYDGNQPVHEGTGAAGVAPEWSYVWLGSTLLKATGSSAGERFVHQDRLGSVVMETHSNAGAVQVLGRASYDPYGRPTPIPSWSGASLQVPYGYSGARRENAAGLYLMGARWYDPTLGRFIEQDPIGELGGVNLYAYTGSSPISWTDPSGLYTKGGKNRLAYGKPEAATQAKGGGGPGGIPGSRRTGPGADNTRYTVDGVSINDPVSGQANPRSVAAYLRMSADPRAEWKQAREQAANWGRPKADEVTTETARAGGLRFKYSEGNAASGGVSSAPHGGSESIPEDIGARETVDVVGELPMGPGWGTFIKLGVDSDDRRLLAGSEGEWRFRPPNDRDTPSYFQFGPDGKRRFQWDYHDERGLPNPHVHEYDFTQPNPRGDGRAPRPGDPRPPKEVVHPQYPLPESQDDVPHLPGAPGLLSRFLDLLGLSNLNSTEVTIPAAIPNPMLFDPLLRDGALLDYRVEG